MDDGPTPDEFMRMYFHAHASRRHLVLIGEGELDEENCWDKLLIYGSIDAIEMTADRRAAFVYFSCDHAPLLVARCYAFENPSVPFPSGVKILLPGCSFDNYITLHNVPRELSTRALNMYFAEWAAMPVQVYRPGPPDRPSYRAVVALPEGVASDKFMDQGLRVVVPVNGVQHDFFAIPRLDHLADTSGVMTMHGCEECNLAQLRPVMLNEQRKQERVEDELRRQRAARGAHAEDEGYVSPDGSMLNGPDLNGPVVPAIRPSYLDIPEERIPPPSPKPFDPNCPEFVPAAHRPMAIVIPEQRVPFFEPNDAPELPSLLDLPVGAPPEPLLAVAEEKKSPEVQRNESRASWHPVALPPPPAYSTPYVARPMLPRPIPKEEKWDDVPSVTEEVNVELPKVKDPSPRPSTNVFMTPTLPRLDEGGASAFPPELFPKPRPPITPKDKKKKKKKRKGSNTDEPPVVSDALTPSTAFPSPIEPNNDGITEPPVTHTRGGDKSMEYSNQARSSPIQVHNLSFVESYPYGQDGIGLEPAPCTELSTMRLEEYGIQESWTIPASDISERWDDVPALAPWNNDGQGEYDNQDHTTVSGFGFGRGASTEKRQIEETKGAGNGLILSSTPFAIEDTSEQANEGEKKEVEQRDRSYSIVSTVSCQSRTASEEGRGGEEENGDDVSSLRSSVTCLSSEVDSEDEFRREVQQGGGEEEDGGTEGEQRATVDFPTANDVFDASENTNEMEEGERRAALDFPTANDVFDASENTNEMEEGEQRGPAPGAPCVTSAFSMMLSRGGSEQRMEEEGGDSEHTCLEESAIFKEERMVEEGAAEEEQRDSELTCVEFSDDEDARKDAERDSDDLLSGKEDQKPWRSGGPHPIAAVSVPEASTIEALSDAIETKEEEENQYQAYEPVADDISEEEKLLLAEAQELIEFEEIEEQAYEFVAALPVTVEEAEDEKLLLAEEKELIEFEEIEAQAYEFVAALPVIVEEEEEGTQEEGTEEEDEEEGADAVGDIMNQVAEENRDPVASPTVALEHTDSETSREASEISDDETIGHDSNRSEDSCTLSDASSDTIVNEDGYVVHPDEWDEQDQIQYGIRKHTALSTIDEEEEEDEDETLEEEQEENEVVEAKEEDTTSAVSTSSTAVSSRDAAADSEDSDDEFRPENEYYSRLTREAKTVREVSKAASVSPSDRDIVPRPSTLPGSSWGMGIVIEEKPAATVPTETTNDPQAVESATVSENAPSVRAPSFLSTIRALAAAKNNAPSE